MKLAERGEQCNNLMQPGSLSCVFAVMESRIEKYRRMAADAKLRAAKTKDAFQQRAFNQAADNWLKVADDVEQMERNRTSAFPRFRRL
jgi:hypothetical protein